MTIGPQTILFGAGGLLLTYALVLTIYTLRDDRPDIMDPEWDDISY